jgi:cytochrome c553
VKTVLHVLAALFVQAIDWVTGASRTASDTPHAPIVRFVVKHPWMTATVGVTAIGIAAAVVVVSGVMPIRASSGHWPITERLLDFAKVQSVRTYSLGVQAPPLDDYALVVRGAAHYAVGCEPCHGSPDVRVPPVMAAMTPAPPALSGDRLTRWQPKHLFSIVKHGIKFTGMPGWPVQQRDDEVWAVVAFVARLSRMDRAEYRRLVQRDPPADARQLPVAGTLSPGTPSPRSSLQPPQAVREVCWRCHGVDGTGGEHAAFPSLAGQRAAYLHDALRAFADRTRFSGTMTEIAARLGEAEIREIAAYYEQLSARIAAPAADAAAFGRGETIATRGLPNREIPACVECHGPADVPRNPAYPRLAGQDSRYLMRQLELLKQRRRGGSPRVNLMHAVVDRLDVNDIRDVALYYASTGDDRPAVSEPAPAP